VVGQAINKRTEGRYQTMDDLVADLKSVRREIERRPESLAVEFGDKSGRRAAGAMRGARSAAPRRARAATRRRDVKSVAAKFLSPGRA
jgi:hypothetical protein